MGCPFFDGLFLRSQLFHFGFHILLQCVKLDDQIGNIKPPRLLRVTITQPHFQQPTHPTQITMQLGDLFKGLNIDMAGGPMTKAQFPKPGRDGKVAPSRPFLKQFLFLGTDPDQDVLGSFSRFCSHVFGSVPIIFLAFKSKPWIQGVAFR